MLHHRFRQQPALHGRSDIVARILQQSIRADLRAMGHHKFFRVSSEAIAPAFR